MSHDTIVSIPSGAGLAREQDAIQTSVAQPAAGGSAVWLDGLWRRSGLSQAEIAARSGASKTTISRFFGGKLQPDEALSRRILAVMREAAGDRMDTDERIAPAIAVHGTAPTICPASTYTPTIGAPWGGAFCTQGQRLMWSLLQATLADRELTLLTGPSGSGKSFVVARFVEAHPEVVVFGARMGMTGGGLLTRLCQLLGLAVSGTNDQRTERLIGAAEGRALVVDEADLLVSGRHERNSLGRLEIFRQLQEAGAAVVLVGLPALHRHILASGETYVFSRIGYFRSAPAPTLDELAGYWRGQVAGYPQALAKAGPMALLAQRSGLFRHLTKLARRTRELDGDVEAAASLLFRGSDA